MPFIFRIYIPLLKAVHISLIFRYFPFLFLFFAFSSTVLKLNLLNEVYAKRQLKDAVRQVAWDSLARIFIPNVTTKTSGGVLPFLAS